jgi:NAD(P)-dependent dehydrogenase (short-subunit alcohol dehydrogenase family)
MTKALTGKLTGKVALVTGGSRGIGAASARALADEGANVAISYVASPDKAEAVVTELKAKGVEARAFKADQASTADVERLVQDVARYFGRLASSSTMRVSSPTRRSTMPMPTRRRSPVRTPLTCTA